MAVKIADLVATTSVAATDIFHLRTAGNIDKKITSPNVQTFVETGFTIENRITDPGAPATGQIWFRTDL